MKNFKIPDAENKELWLWFILHLLKENPKEQMIEALRSYAKAASEEQLQVALSFCNSLLELKELSEYLVPMSDMLCATTPSLDKLADCSNLLVYRSLFTEPELFKLEAFKDKCLRSC